MRLLPLLLLPLLRAADPNWSAYGGNPAGTRYSPLKQINRSNVARLQLAWTYDTAEGPNASQTQPIIIDGVLYALTPKHKVIALNAATGKLIWKFDSGITGRGQNRGVTHWASAADRRIFSAQGSFVYALDAATGKPIPEFGADGRIDLRENLGRDPGRQSIALTTPGIIYKDSLILGGRTSESLPGSPGDIRAYDVRTGKLRWSFHTIPHPGETGYDTWPKDAWTYSGSANNWSGMALDEKRGIVYAPTGSAASDFYGGDRVGDNLFANTLLALNAETGERIWHFQAVKHDMWDRDFPSPPTLVTIRHEGKRVDAVAQTTKQGWVYLFDRVTGKPLFPIEYRNYPASDVPGEVAAETQPLPARPAPFARQSVTEDTLTNRTPEAHQWALDRFRKLRGGGQFFPFTAGHDTLIFPGYDGGAEWGGSAFDPETCLLFVNANEMAWTGALAEVEAGSSGRQIYLNNCATCHGDTLAGAPPQIPSLVDIAGTRTQPQLASIVREGAGRMPGFPNLRQRDLTALLQYLVKPVASPAGPATRNYRFTGYNKFLDPDGYPAVAPPWGTLNAINLNTGECAWKIPFGEYPELHQNTGTENYGGPIVTAGGLLFIAATDFDRKFRAFDKRTGKLLWETILPFAGNATPATYQVAGRQYVVIYATGGKGKSTDPTGGAYLAFALP